MTVAAGAQGLQQLRALEEEVPQLELDFHTLSGQPAGPAHGPFSTRLRCAG